VKSVCIGLDGRCYDEVVRESFQVGGASGSAFGYLIRSGGLKGRGNRVSCGDGLDYGRH
jgi:hypothetical protein